MAESHAQIGVLDLQGGVAEHLEHFAAIGVNARPVKHGAEFAGLRGLVVPGGESTCLRTLVRVFELEKPLLDAARNGTRLWGTCAGAILLAKTSVGEGTNLGLIDIDVERNAFGSQLDSFSRTVAVPGIAPEPVPLTFIRAPKIVRTGPDVKVLLRLDDYVAAAESEQTLVTVFHPELTPTVAYHRHFARACGALPETEAAAAAIDSKWTLQSWMRFYQHPDH